MRFGRFLHFIVQRSRSMAWLMVCVGVLSGLLSAGVLALINYVLHHSSDHSLLVLLGFISLVAGKILANLGSQILLVRFAQDTILDLSLSLCAKIVRAPLRRSEQRGAANILVTLTDDVSWVTWAIQCFPHFLMNVALVLGCGIFLAWLSWKVFLVVAGVAVVSVLGQQWLHTSTRSIIAASREARAELFQCFRSLTDGLKELMMHRSRREEFINQEVRGAAEFYRETNLKATRIQALLGVWTQVSLYSLIGSLIFLFPSFGSIDSEALTGYIVAVLYVMGPISSILGTAPTLERGQVALENIERLGISLDVGLEDVQTRDSGRFRTWALPSRAVEQCHVFLRREQWSRRALHAWPHQSRAVSERIGVRHRGQWKREIHTRKSARWIVSADTRRREAGRYDDHR